jgi:hypothetical protein
VAIAQKDCMFHVHRDLYAAPTYNLGRTLSVRMDVSPVGMQVHFSRKPFVAFFAYPLCLDCIST